MNIKNLLIGFIIFFSPLLKGQKLSGTATFQSSATVEVDFDETRFSPEDIERIKDRMRSALNKEYELTFNAKESVYSEKEKLEQGSGGRGMWMSMMMGSSGITYKDLSSKVLLNQTEFYGKMFLITDTLEDYKWKLGKETKMIGSYTCYKATTNQEVIMRKFGPPRDDNDKRVDTIQADIVAWYTPMIPMSMGPADYWGLPGMIMEISTPNLKILCTKIELDPNADSEIIRPKKGEEVGREEYNAIVRDKMEEMRKMYQNDHRGGGGGRGHF